MNKKILVHEDAQLARQIYSDLNDLRPSLMKVKQAFEKLEIGPFTNLIFQSLKKKESAIKQMFDESIDTEIKRMKVTKTIMIESIKERHQELYSDFIKTLRNAKAHKVNPHAMRKKLNFEDISFRNSEFVISLADKENILEKYCRIYLETEAEIRAYRIAESIRDSYNNFVELVKELKCPTNLNTFSGLYNIVQREKDSFRIEINPGGLKGMCSYLQRQKEAI